MHTWITIKRMLLNFRLNIGNIDFCCFLFSSNDTSGNISSDCWSSSGCWRWSLLSDIWDWTYSSSSSSSSWKPCSLFCLCIICSLLSWESFMFELFCWLSLFSSSSSPEDESRSPSINFKFCEKRSEYKSSGFKIC